MAKIDVYTSEMSSLASRLKKISSVIQNAEQVAGKVQGNLDFQVAAKADIAGGLSRVRKQLRGQQEKVAELSQLTSLSVSEFRTADSKMDKRADNILGKIASPVAGMVLGVKQLFVGASVSRHKAISSIFMPAGTIITVAGIRELIQRLSQIVNRAKGNGGVSSIGGAASGTGTTHQPQTVKKPTGNAAVQPNVVNNGKLKPYQGGYSNYNVVNSFDSKYLLDQHAYDIYNSKGNNCGCMACGVAMMQYMKTGKYINPENPKIWNDKSKQTQWTYIQKVAGSSKRSVDDQLKILYNNLNEGTPVMIALSAKNNLSSTHNVVVVGIRQGADINHLQKSDFLVADPNGGAVRTIAEAESACGKIMRDGDNYTMWKANNEKY